MVDGKDIIAGSKDNLEVKKASCDKISNAKKTWNEIRKHSTKESCWIVIYDQIYDVTDWLQTHPGGSLTILNLGGKDATDAFSQFHPKQVWSNLGNYRIGSVEDPVEVPEALKDFRSLHRQMLRDNLFQTNYSWYIPRILIAVTLFCLGIYGTQTSSTLITVIGALCMGFFWQQIAFFGHDFGHSAVTHDRLRDSFINVCFVILFFGVGNGWWKRSHNIHHIVTNSMQNDPDVQHFPVMAISEKFFKGFTSTFHNKRMKFDFISKFFISKQHYLFYPIMAFARFNLYAQTWILHLTDTNLAAFPLKTLEMFTLVGYWCWYGYLVSCLPTTSLRILYVLVSHWASLLLHVQIVLSHFAEPVVTNFAEKDYNFVETQVFHSVDIHCPAWLDWFHGGLQFQTVHHLFPRLPRHNLRFVREEYVKPYCKKHNLPYYEYTFIDANKRVLACLKRAAEKAQQLDEVWINTWNLNG